MAATYILISSNVLTGSQATVTFSAIPSTYTDLVIRCSTRSDSASTDTLRAYYNGASGTTSFSYTQIKGDGSAATSGRISGAAVELVGSVDSTVDTASTFSSTEIYIPSYTASQYKPAGVFSAKENNATASVVYAIADLFSDNTAISSITLSCGGNFVSGSSFYLYGIKNA